jgi:hypothetical protein
VREQRPQMIVRHDGNDTGPRHGAPRGCPRARCCRSTRGISAPAQSVLPYRAVLARYVDQYASMYDAVTQSSVVPRSHHVRLQTC